MPKSLIIEKGSYVKCIYSGENAQTVEKSIYTIRENVHTIGMISIIFKKHMDLEKRILPVFFN